MKIGVTIDNIDSLANWQQRVIQHILDMPELELVAIITAKNSSRTPIQKLRIPKNIFTKILLKIQCQIERKFFFKKPNTANLDKLENISMFSISEESLSQNTTDLKKLHSLQLDLIIKLNKTNNHAQLSPLAQRGVWFLKHNADHISADSPIGFWEILKKEATVNVSLIGIEKNTQERIDQAFFNRHWSLVKTSDMILESSVALLVKNLKSNVVKKQIDQKLATVQTTFAPPNFIQIANYTFQFHIKIIAKIFERIAAKVFKWRYQCYTLFINSGQFNETDLSILKPINLPKGEFWADPFLFEYKNETYVFFENYPYSTKRGKISCGKLKNDKIIEVIDILDLDYHLSYPFIFEENGEIFLMPESSENKSLDIYKCVKFPDKWELHISAFEGELIADAFFYNDEQGDKWLFLNKGDETTVPLENELHIYKVDSFNSLDSLTPHSQNPVLIDSRTARNGGAIYHNNNETYRPSQGNDYGVYGRSLNINKIIKLNLDEYIEETIRIIEPNFHKGIISVHHLHQSDNHFVIDAAYKRH